ncbi:MAG: hypothetical protein BA871_16805 [Desulfuromonadales bacterium C00003096]|nr:MAG: hypothetical protein BA871_16805 [Desulfuromonadales bacterium C00003096]
MGRLPMETCKGTVTELPQSPTEGCPAPSTPLSKSLNLKSLINKINYIHFLDGTITATFRHKRYGTLLSLLVKPQPCLDKELVCSWDTTDDLQQKLQSHQFEHLLINDGNKTLLVEPSTIQINRNVLVFCLPKECSELHSRSTRRHNCVEIMAQLIQNGSNFRGSLIEFSATSLHIRINASPPQTFQWLNPETPAALILSRHGETIYSTEVSILKQSYGQHMRSIVLLPTSDRIFKFKPKKYRSNRQHLIPSPSINFCHPLTGKSIDLDVDDLSGSGLSVTEQARDSVLLPGLIISELSLTFANSDSLQCKAQVVYRIKAEELEEQNTVRCGIAFLDMKTEEQSRLLAMLYQAVDKNSYLSNRVDLDALWKFFFDSGFIYPEKYLHLKTNKTAFETTYRKLYKEKPNIARHFIHQANGTILAHMSMIRFYRNSWLIHHHAATNRETRKGGLSVLSQISRYANEAHNLYSAHLDFVFCYFRPNNRFPKRVFGGVAKHINDPKGCSIDSFSYFHFKKSFSDQWNMSQPWSFNRANAEDLQELKRFIEHSSGGLMVPALDLDQTTYDDSELFDEYTSLGMKRERHLFSLKIKGSLKAIVILNISEIFLNMSDLTNCFKIIVIEQQSLTKDVLFLMLSMLCVKFDIDNIPALVYPTDFAEKTNIPVEKTYNLWILNLQHLDSYFDYCSRIIPNFTHQTTVSSGHSL